MYFIGTILKSPIKVYLCLSFSHVTIVMCFAHFCRGRWTDADTKVNWTKHTGCWPKPQLTQHPHTHTGHFVERLAWLPSFFFPLSSTFLSHSLLSPYVFALLSYSTTVTVIGCNCQILAVQYMGVCVWVCACICTCTVGVTVFGEDSSLRRIWTIRNQLLVVGFTMDVQGCMYGEIFNVLQ